MKYIKLTQRFKDREPVYTMVDDGDYELLNQWSWRFRDNGYTKYAFRVIKFKCNYVVIHMHRFLLHTPEQLQVDHIDGNGLNNQRNNIRNCTFQENILNKKHHGKSKYTGVCYNGKNIRSVIFVNNKQLHLGYYKSEEDAALAYNCAALTYFGQFAKLNIIEL